MLFWRVKPLDKILETAEKKSLKRQLGPIQLTLLGIGAVIGTGIFVLTAEAAQKAGPAMMLAFVIAAIVCGLAALAYAELAAMIPVSGSAYTYTYGVLGEFVAWIVGWALGLEYGIGAAVVCVGWSGYMNGLLAQKTFFGGALALPDNLRMGLFAGGGFNLLAFLIGLAVTVLLVIGTSKSARVNAVLVAIKIVALTFFIFYAFPAVKSSNFEPFLPGGWGSPLGGVGVLGAAASIFFAYVGFDAVSTAAEETKNPNRNIPIGLIASLTICTIFYLLVGYAAAGSVGAQPMLGADGLPLDPGTPAMVAACVNSEALVCSKEPLAHVLRLLGHNVLGDWIGIAAILALPSVILMMMFGQTRIFFTMSRDGLLPDVLSKVHPRFFTPHVITILTGVVPGWQTRGHLELRHPARVCNGLDRCADPAQAATEPPAPVPHATRMDRLPTRGVRLPAAVRQPEHDRESGVRRVGPDRSRDLPVVWIQAQSACPRLRGLIEGIAGD